MSSLTSEIIPSILTLKTLGDTDSFIEWMQKEHPEIDVNYIFEGYKFSLTCCLNSFLEGITYDSKLGIRNDFLLNHAIGASIPIHKIKSTCEKTLFLKNIKPHIKSITRAKTYSEVRNSIKTFNEKIGSIFEKILKDHISISKKIKIDKETCIRLWLLDYAHTFLVQINNNGPTANSMHPLSTEWTKEDRKEVYLEGYKYSIQFLWFTILGESEYRKTQLTKMHLADSWRTYKYVEKEKTGDTLIDFINQDFELDEQTSFDSFFYWIQREITEPLSEKYGVDPFRINLYFIFNGKNYKKKELFEKLLLKNSVSELTLKGNWEEQINELMYWYPFEIINSHESQMHYGVSSFNTMLAGTVALHNSEESDFEKILVLKFTHPLSSKGDKNNYSYGILVDSRSASGNYSSGWVIFQNACGDYSGFSGSQYKAGEKLISKYKKERKIQLRELKIPLRDFEKFTDQYTLDRKELSILERNKLIPDIIQKSRAYAFELFVFQVCVKQYDKFKVEWSVGKSTIEGEKDIVVSNDEEVILIECKLNPQSNSMEEIVAKLKAKLASFKQPRKSAQLWFWHGLSVENRQKLDELSSENFTITVIEVSDPKGNRILNGVDLKPLQFIMQDYEDYTDDFPFLNFPGSLEPISSTT